jgi:hypothetical protein
MEGIFYLSPCPTQFWEPLVLQSSRCEVSSCDVKPVELEGDHTCVWSEGLEFTEHDHLILCRVKLSTGVSMNSRVLTSILREETERMIFSQTH